MTATSHQALYRSSPLILGGLLAALALAIAGGAAGLQIVAHDRRLPLVLGMLGAFVLIFMACAGGPAPASLDDRRGWRADR